MILFPDTNVFLQCRAIHEVPWGDAVEADEIELLISAPVQDEIDRLKNDGNARRARRARDANSLFRAMLASADESLTVRDSAPRVTLRFAPTLPPRRETAETLDLTRADDRLLDEAMYYRRTEPTAQILTLDTGMMLRARRHGVPLIAVPESWLLPPEKDERDRQIGVLQAEVAGLRSAEAELSLSLMNEAGEEVEAIDGILPMYPDLTETEIAELLDSIKRRHPEVTTFSNAPASGSASGELEGLRSMFEKLAAWNAPTSDQIERYKKSYADWIEKARKTFEQLGPLLNVRDRLRRFRIALANAGSRPADEVLVEFKIHGAATLLASVGEDVPDLIAQTEKLPRNVALPWPPNPPKGEYLYETFARNAQYGGLDIAAALRNHMPDYSDIRSSFTKRDRHRFYRREDDDKPVTEASFTCEEFRHQRAPELFSLWVVVPMQNEIVKARLHVRASARNLRTPVDLYVPIEVRSETRATYAVAEKWRIEEASDAD